MKEYVRPVRADWWLKKPSYTLFMLRELTAVFVAGYAVFLLVLIYRATEGREAFAAFVEGLKSPVSIVLHLLVLAMAIYHSVTWFSAVPKITVFWRGEEKVSAGTILAVNYAVWVVVSVVVAGIALAASR
jgi:fumarate reductase subunit C